MKTSIHLPDPTGEFHTDEGCWILEIWNTPADPAVSIARARVEPGVTTQLHRLRGVAERYVVVAGTGLVRVGAAEPARVQPGAVVSILPGVTQQVTNDGTTDLVFTCICTPRFTPECYQAIGQSAS